MKSRVHMAAMLAAAVSLSPLAPLPAIEQQRRDPVPARVYDPGERLSRRQRKKARIAERKKIKAGVAGAKLSRKAAAGKL